MIVMIKFIVKKTNKKTDISIVIYTKKTQIMIFQHINILQPKCYVFIIIIIDLLNDM